MREDALLLILGMRDRVAVEEALLVRARAEHEARVVRERKAEDEAERRVLACRYTEDDFR